MKEAMATVVNLPAAAFRYQTSAAGKPAPGSAAAECCRL
jgi:hypothetical protein